MISAVTFRNILQKGILALYLPMALRQPYLYQRSVGNSKKINMLHGINLLPKESCMKSFSHFRFLAINFPVLIFCLTLIRIFRKQTS